MRNPLGNTSRAEAAPERTGPSRVVELLDAIAGRAVPIIVALAVVTSLACMAIAASGRSEVSFADESDYLSIATHLADGDGYTMDGEHATAFRPPGLPVVLSITAVVSPELRALRVLNAALAGLTVLVGALLARRLAGDLAGVLGALVLTASPVAVFTATKLYPQTLASVAMIAAMYASVALVDTNGRRRVLWACGAGAALSLLTLTVPNHGVTMVVALGWLAWRLRREAIVPAVALGLCFLVPIGVWTVRNQSAVDGFVPLSTNSGINLLLGNTDGAGASTGVSVDISEHIAIAHERELDEVEIDRFFRERATEWIAEDPVRAGRLYAAKTLNTFSIQQELATEDQKPPLAATLVIGATYLPVLALFLLRPFLTSRIPLRRGEGLLILCFWANVAATALAFTRIRFRVPIDPLMVVVATCLVVGWLDRTLGQDGVTPSDDPGPVADLAVDHAYPTDQTPTSTGSSS